MVLLTRLDGREVLVNDDLVVTVEHTPDTVIHLMTGDRIVVREKLGDVLENVVKFRRRVFSGPWTPLVSEGAPVTQGTPLVEED
jgi:flagellar protein FlbD